MNQSKISPREFGKKLIISASVSILIFGAVLLLSSYLLFQIPGYESYYFVFPWFVLAVQALFVSLICKRHGDMAILFSFFVSLIISLLSILLGAISGGSDFQFKRIIVQFCIFMLSTVAIQFCLLRIKPKRKKSTKRFPFSK